MPAGRRIIEWSKVISTVHGAKARSAAGHRPQDMPGMGKKNAHPKMGAGFMARLSTGEGSRSIARSQQSRAQRIC